MVLILIGLTSPKKIIFPCLYPVASFREAVLPFGPPIRTVCQPRIECLVGREEFSSMLG